MSKVRYFRSRNGYRDLYRVSDKGILSVEITTSPGMDSAQMRHINKNSSVCLMYILLSADEITPEEFNHYMCNYWDALTSLLSNPNGNENLHHRTLG